MSKPAPEAAPAMDCPTNAVDQASAPPQSIQDIVSHEKIKRHIISVLVKNVPGLLAGVANLFAARGYNIESLTVAETEDPRFSRMTIVVRGEESILEHMKKGLRKFVNVIRVMDFTGLDFVERDLALIKVNVPAGARQEIFQIVDVFEGKIVDIAPKECVVELVGPERKVEAFLELMRPFGIKEMTRTGRAAMARGPRMEGRELP